MKRIVLGIQYDGAPWQGYQTQPHACTVQDKLEGALQQFTRQIVNTTCAGRTDTGVHALEQVVHFDSDLTRRPSSWVRGTNAFLPPSIAVRWMTEIETEAGHEESEFHARFSARARTYHYVLYNNPIYSPILSGKAGWMFRPLDVALMQQGAAYLIGTHDFTAFRAAHCQARSPVKLMHEITIKRDGDVILFSLCANAFLHHMVRNIIGALVYVGIGKHPPQWMAKLLSERNRCLAAPTFMPDGLYLGKIDYDPKWGLPQQTHSLPWF